MVVKIESQIDKNKEHVMETEFLEDFVGMTEAGYHYVFSFVYIVCIGFQTNLLSVNLCCPVCGTTS